MNCPHLVMHEGFYCGFEGRFYMPKAHRLNEYCYDVSYAETCRKYRESVRPGVLSSR